jgi:hypothetical protein
VMPAVADNRSDENVVPFPRRRADSGSSWEVTIAEAQRRLDRSAAEIEAHIAQVSPCATGRMRRKLGAAVADAARWIALLAAASIALFLSTVLSQSVAAAFVAGVVVFAFGAAMYAHLSSVGYQRSLAQRTGFEALRDTDVNQRNDAAAYVFIDSFLRRRFVCGEPTLARTQEALRAPQIAHSTRYSPARHSG